ncbi:DUF1642 domain-containing protein [Streptococcus pseudopneumoniae]|nr:DUF1642 domain-containing protein [Streptococcus pseudopneumoniae]MBF9649467.1 DUF1642 domain-containing protein [Streptococcus pseudopneumoniae]MBW8105401.1 DUF1642 domain-containing protein [Streptococcus pseudopneumoniae]
MNKQELIKEFEEIGIHGLNMFGTVVKVIPTKTAIDLIKQLDEPEKIKVPQFVAEWIEEARKACKDVAELFEFNFTNDEVRKWFMQERPFDLVAHAWLDGYEVEKEKRYEVKIKASGQYLAKTKLKEISFMYNGACSHFTRKELEDADFGWVFSCEGIEIEEVE